MKIKAAFLDRDGVINKDFGYVYQWSKFVFVDGILDLLLELKHRQFELFIVTNQSGIAREYFNEKDLSELHGKMLHELRRKKIQIRDIYYCPHLANMKRNKYAIECSCRKPKPGMIHEATSQHNINLGNSVLIGDKLSDVHAGKNAGVRHNFLISHEQSDEDGIFTFRDLNELVYALKNSEHLADL